MGSTVVDNSGNHWHFSTMAISVNFKFERRLGMYPSGFEKDGQMFVNTAYGDYPHYLPNTKVEAHKNRFTGWMLLSLNKPAYTNSNVVTKDVNVVDESDGGYMLEQIKNFEIPNINDEEIRSYWVSEANNDSIYVEMDLEKAMDIHAIQINFQDYNSTTFGRHDTLRQQFVIKASKDGKKWFDLVDFSNNSEDRPHCYIELEAAVEARYIRYEHLYCTNKYLAISEFRVFGKGKGEVLTSPYNFTVKRDTTDRRNAFLRWDKNPDATGYVIYWGIKSDRLNLSAMIYGENEYELRALNTDQEYYYQIETFNENGVSERSVVKHTK